MNRSNDNGQYRTRTRSQSTQRKTRASGTAQRTRQAASRRPTRPRTQSGSQAKPSRQKQQPVRGKRTSVKAVAQRQVKRKSAINSKNLKRIKNPIWKTATRVLATIAIVVVIALVGAAAVIFQNDSSKYSASEQWRPVVSDACTENGLDAAWTDCLLAVMVIESGADENVESVLGVHGDIMQAAEGAYGWIVTDGWPDHALAPETPEASIYAGALEFKQSLELWESYLGPITPEDTTEIQLVIQGYNFGSDGWFTWCKNRDIHAYTVELAREYSNTQMPQDAKGTPTHAQKWLDSYKIIHTT